MFNHDLPRKNHDLHISIPILTITIGATHLISESISQSFNILL